MKSAATHSLTLLFKTQNAEENFTFPAVNITKQRVEELIENLTSRPAFIYDISYEYQGEKIALTVEQDYQTMKEICEVTISIVVATEKAVKFAFLQDFKAAAKAAKPQQASSQIKPQTTTFSKFRKDEAKNRQYLLNKQKKKDRKERMEAKRVEKELRRKTWKQQLKAKSNQLNNLKTLIEPRQQKEEEVKVPSYQLNRQIQNKERTGIKMDANTERSGFSAISKNRYERQQDQDNQIHCQHLYDSQKDYSLESKQAEEEVMYKHLSAVGQKKINNRNDDLIVVSKSQLVDILKKFLRPECFKSRKEELEPVNTSPALFTHQKFQRPQIEKWSKGQLKAHLLNGLQPRLMNKRVVWRDKND